MDNSNGPTTPSDEVSRSFAGYLGELEDLATTLTQRQAALARELAEVDDELRRIEAVRAAMTGKPRRMPVSGASRNSQRAGRSNARTEKIREWARGREEFTGHDVAQLLNMETRGVGPILAGMARRGELTVREDSSNHRYYTIAAPN